MKSDLPLCSFDMTTRTALLQAAQRSLKRARLGRTREVEVLASASREYDEAVQAAPRRVVVDGFLSRTEVNLLRGAAARALAAMFGAEPTGDAATDASLPLLAPGLAAPELLGDRAASLAHDIADRAASTARGHGFGSELGIAGSLLSRLRAPRCGAVEFNPTGSELGVHGYWAPHVDKANVESYDVSAVMYLASAGEHFEGGEFAFIDETADRLVEARAGRLLLFDSEDDQRGALHNLHQVRPVVGEGQRLALSVWFTRGEGG